MKILKTKPYPTNKAPGGGYVDVQDETGVFNAWTPQISALKEGQDVPQGWVRSDSDMGPRLLPPREPKSGGGGGGGFSAYRNTKEGMEAEQVSIHRSVALEWACRTYGEEWWRHVDKIFRWLRQPSANIDVTKSSGSDPSMKAEDAGHLGAGSVPPSGPVVGEGAEGVGEGPGAPFPSDELWAGIEAS
jgi:hypothetical protein